MGSSPSKKEITSTVTLDGHTEYHATDAAGSDMVAAIAAKASMEDHKARMKEHPEILELLAGFKIAVQKMEIASEGEITHEVLNDVTEAVEEYIEQVMYTYETNEQKLLIGDQLGYDGFVQASIKYCKAIQKDGTLERDPETASATMTLLNTIASLADRSEVVCNLSKLGLIELLLNELKRTVLLEQYSTNAELVQGMSSLVNHDKNKQIIVKQKGLKLLVKLMKEGDDKETYWATRCVWTLAFDDDNKEKIKKEPNAISTLEKLKSHDSQEVRNAAEGALWVIQGEQEHIREQGSPEKCVKAEGIVPSKEVVGDHVMISYQWDVQKLMIKIKEQLLKSGYRVWLDLDEMGGSTLQAMADAVEKASVVLVCVSQKYKDSPNCRVEAEYAFQQRKEIIPLLVDENYKPTGWLGAIIGTKFYINFANKTQPFGVCIQHLVKELGDKGRTIRSPGKKPDSDISAMSPSMGMNRPITAHPVSKWTNRDVHDWLKNNEIQCTAMETVIGEDIVFLLHMKAEAPEFFYYYTLKNLGLTSLPEMRKLRNALARLS
ncbi:uncharacterized protein LOC100368265 [Saccoglossus kowalevskii]|uniref:Uncharacterized protein LOC100368265 n=1 Tax=Saccoglossus kowalevskii TaxID=10224 RepID=A0ABM0GMC8_SACKO|nr:PREDICTED: uncharacterized protein LOC100368265 [Saccoglossus kowalevskii]